MPTSYGVTPAGFLAPTTRELIALFETDQLAGISASLDVSVDSVFGQNNGIYAFYLAQAWEAIQASYSGFDPDKAEAAMLTMLAKLTGTPRPAATKSIAKCTIEAEVGTVLLSGTHFASVVTKPDVKFTPKANFTAAAYTTYDVLFESEGTGAVQAASESLTVIATPVVGWVSIENPAAAVAGSPIATDAQLRVQRQLELTRAGASTIDAVYADLVALLAGIDGASVAPFNNVNDATDANGLPGHSFEMVLHDPSGGIDNDTIAQTIWDSKPAGIRSYGSSQGNAIDKTSTTQVVNFTKATPVPILISYLLVPRSSYVGDANFKDAVVFALSNGIIGLDASGAHTTILERYATGVDVNEYDLTVATQGLGAQVGACNFGVAGAPLGSVVVVIGPREVATFSAANITLGY